MQYFRQMTSFHVEKIEIAGRTWNILVYRDDTPEQREWVDKIYLDMVLRVLKERK